MTKDREGPLITYVREYTEQSLNSTYELYTYTRTQDVTHALLLLRLHRYNDDVCDLRVIYICNQRQSNGGYLNDTCEEICSRRNGERERERVVGSEVLNMIVKCVSERRRQQLQYHEEGDP